MQEAVFTTEPCGKTTCRATPKPTVLSSVDEPFCGDEGPRMEDKIRSEVHG